MGFNNLKEELYSEPHLKHLRTFFEKCPKLKRKNVSCASDYVKHMWHGDHKNRGYENRNFILKQHNYNPDIHLQLNSDGCYEWTPQSQMLEKQVKMYFDSRKEDG